MKKHMILLLLAAMALSGCAGGTTTESTAAPAGGTTPGSTVAPNTLGLVLSDEVINRPLPSQFKNRAFFNIPGIEIIRPELDDLAGRILICKVVEGKENTERCSLQLPRIISEGTTPAVKLIENGQVYNSKVDQKASLEGSYLVVTAGFSAEKLAEITITDTSYVYIKANEVPLNALRAYVRDQPKADTEKRYWIQGVQVATITLKDYKKFNITGDATLGPVTNIKGSYYQAGEAVTTDYGISLVIADIDHDIPAALPGPSAVPESYIAPPRELVIDSVTNLEQLPAVSP